MVPSFGVKTITALVMALVLSACASTGPRDGLAATDNYEPFSRVAHTNNVRIDRYFIRPVSQGYDFVTPTVFQHMITNGLSHIDLTNDFINYALQGDVEETLDTLGRFTLNTILGMGGLLDPATEFGIAKDDTDFGLTLASYGVGEGSYLVLPIIGPTTMRDSAGFIVDRAFSPLTYLGPLTAVDGVGPVVTGLGFVDARTRNADLIDEVLYNSEDSYVTLRAAYLQRRRAQTGAGGDPADNLPDIFDDAPEQQ
ncbi:MAG: MlaA family lipoprotein [Pseudomonadota bacterium]